MNKWLLMMMAVSLSVLAACGGSNESGSTGESDTNENEKQTIKVAVVESPMLDVVEIAKENLAAENIELEMVKMGDYIQPNEALANNEVDAHFTMHFPMMNQFNQNSETNLVEVQPIYYANFGFYSQAYTSMEDLPDDATIGIANDPANLDRSLRMLAFHDLIELNEIESGQYDIRDIKEDSHNFQFEQAGLAALTRLYKDVDGVMLSPTHANNIDLTPDEDALIREKEDNEFAVILVAREDNADSELIKQLTDAMTRDNVREFLESNQGGSSVPAF